ncbi:unnamed protein product [Somion occarium]|uniref:DUF7719 domain-containing protein n=1 Tax=Somion occarium TaxID=3059160 RepID=A0ABP1D4W6_9APHY
MARNRKPSKKPATEENQQPSVDIPEQEQWRIIKESGILKGVPIENPNSSSNSDEEPEGLSPLVEEIFSAINLIILHSFLLIMMEILIHYQYGRHPTYGAIFQRMLPSVPFLSVFIFYTSRYKQTRAMQGFLFVLSLAMGIRLIYIINVASWTVNMRQAPPLATIWVYCIVQLNLLPATLSLVIVYGWVYYRGMKLFF